MQSMSNVFSNFIMVHVCVSVVGADMGKMKLLLLICFNVNKLK